MTLLEKPLSLQASVDLLDICGNAEFEPYRSLFVNGLALILGPSEDKLSIPDSVLSSILADDCGAALNLAQAILPHASLMNARFELFCGRSCPILTSFD